TWCDYNGDGRPDLYIPNDWGMNVLFRNDGPAGFTDVTAEMGLTFYGFSMGATFGDVDNDGRDDLYVSNMYSEAGRRMIERLPGLDPQFVESANGNYLYHQQPDGRFAQVGGLQPPAMPVMNAGWSWGGCFADFDNDSFLDLYVLNGYFSAPHELASDLDLESNLWRTMIRADPRMSRATFRYSPEWRRTPPPDNLGAQIDARLAGVERQGDKVLVHSLHGHERNRFFWNRPGRTFVDVSEISGLDNPADSRGFALLDYDRDGWQDVALVNANQPLFNLYHNEMPATGLAGGVIAVRFVGGNRTPSAVSGWACRDGFGARLTLDLGDQKIVREHRCGEGWSVQNSATLLLGIGAHTNAASLSVRWPSGKTNAALDVAEGTLVTVYENPADSPSGTAFVRHRYRTDLKSPAPPPAPGPVFPLRALDTSARPARLRVYTAFATSSPASTNNVQTLRRLREALHAEGVDFIAVPIDRADDDPRLAAFANHWKPTFRLVNLPLDRRVEALAAFTQAFGSPASAGATVVTDDAGHLLSRHSAVPHLSALRTLLPEPR
ncbi:MAG: VCBS repeat-containing protein, partial [Verrucomicrobiales bacterium]|nr:VCBS repeat-containing protein [Verrucomicrobiales bacterium]